ncbi:DNA polymerase III subunit delta' [Elizabethkingia sp. JS20170427COW]|uniref:DNA polymerase III subunit n=1 Tax=Elizabethkingia sp. JS20170427COW TaxID=2583851 RepID=UPI001110AABD|nr:DNA polymerase III subunit delta' [Elizabethkingia sp. JS20170427COW]QCX54112.1 DNA polymerase III subunit delta' [Elizabethkingia sp. JS20170427COW]
MQWKDIIGQESLKQMLQDSISENRISHAQLFIGKEGYGVFPLTFAYATQILIQDNPSALHKIESLNHLDLHFSFPSYSVGNKTVSSNFISVWRKMILENPYASDEDFNTLLDSENKKMFISIHEIEDLIEKFKLKSYEGGKKILIMTRIDKMNEQAANKFLKFLEEPPKDTLILLTAESTDFILPTILSRCQLVYVPQLSAQDIEAQILENYPSHSNKASEIAFASQGDWNIALNLLNQNAKEEEFETYFIQWVRNAFQAKTKPIVLKDIVFWAREISGWSREKQLKFLGYCAEIFRLALMCNYQADQLVYKNLSLNGFKWDKFATFIHGSNIESILDEISNTNLHLLRNGNSKIIWTDMGIKLTRYLHRRAK